VDDLRESPAVEVCRLLHEAGAQVIAFEPYKPGFVSDDFDLAVSIQEALSGVDVAVVLVAHTQFKDLTPEQLKAGMPGRILVDTVGIWSPDKCEAAGFRLYRLGVGDRPVLSA
jgi:UDP-N-acetyl-D-mannosaminuronate dehydrogenase